jgi:hypothetical protein
MRNASFFVTLLRRSIGRRLSKHWIKLPLRESITYYLTDSISKIGNSCFFHFQQVLSEHPALAENAAYNPQEAFTYIFDEKGVLRAGLDGHPSGDGKRQKGTPSLPPPFG